jgi:centromere/kinetochore protein ZW10
VRDGDHSRSSGCARYRTRLEGEHASWTFLSLTQLSTKSILPKSKYYTALGLVVDGVLSRILDSILAISDIPEVESRKLSELCRILTALEGLFVENTSEVSKLSVTQPRSLLTHLNIQSSFVVSYVPSWLKFSYLSELLVCDGLLF